MYIVSAGPVDGKTLSTEVNGESIFNLSIIFERLEINYLRCKYRTFFKCIPISEQLFCINLDVEIKLIFLYLEFLKQIFCDHFDTKMKRSDKFTS